MAESSSALLGSGVMESFVEFQIGQDLSARKRNGEVDGSIVLKSDPKDDQTVGISWDFMPLVLAFQQCR